MPLPGAAIICIVGLSVAYWEMLLRLGLLLIASALAGRGLNRFSNTKDVTR